MPETEKTMLIAGGGLVGLAAALLFADRFRQVILFEKREDPMAADGKEARSLQLVISARGWNTLRLLGFEEEIRAITIDLKGRWHHHDQAKTFEAYSPAGDCISCISREALYRLLCRKAREQHNIRLCFNTEVNQVDFPAKSIAYTDLKDGSKGSLTYDFLLGADGVRSAIASRLNPDGEDFRKEINVYREISVKDAGWERNAFHYWHTETAMIGAFPVFGGGFSLFLVHKEEDMDKLLLRQDSSYFDALFPEISSQLPGLRENFASAKGGILGSKSCQHWHVGNDVAIAGDAAHAVLPFMGQGLNTGLEDLMVLNNFIGPDGTAPGNSLREYETERRPQADAIRAISQEQFRYLTGKFRKEEYAIRQKVMSSLTARGFLPTYSACAFSMEPFSVILAREEQIRRSLA